MREMPGGSLRGGKTRYTSARFGFGLLGMLHKEWFWNDERPGPGAAHRPRPQAPGYRSPNIGVSGPCASTVTRCIARESTV